MQPIEPSVWYWGYWDRGIGNEASFLQNQTSVHKVESLWPFRASVKQPTSTLIPSAQEASLSSLYPSGKLLVIGKCHKFHSPLCLGTLAMWGEQKWGQQWEMMRVSPFHWYFTETLLIFICRTWQTSNPTPNCDIGSCFVILMLTREFAAVLKWNIIPVLPLPRGTAYELMRCRQRCHVFIHSISPEQKKKQHNPHVGTDT